MGFCRILGKLRIDQSAVGEEVPAMDMRLPFLCSTLSNDVTLVRT